MQQFAAPARPLVATMTAAAAADPARAVAFQGAPGANSHVAVSEAFPDALPLPCFDFADAIDAVRDGRADCAVIPIENEHVNGLRACYRYGRRRPLRECTSPRARFSIA